MMKPEDQALAAVPALVVTPALAVTAAPVETDAEKAEREQREYDQAAEHWMSDDACDQPTFDALGTKLLSEFNIAANDRRTTEQRWLKDLRQFKGQYDPEVLALIGPQRSRVFVRKTRVKVKTVDSRVMDLMFPAGSKNWSIDPTPEPTITDEQRGEIEQFFHAQAEMVLQQSAAQAQAQAQANGQAMPQQPPQRLKPSEAQIRAAMVQMTEQAAKRMEKVMEDQLIEAGYQEVVRQALHSGHLYGTGIIKGPLVERRVRTQYVKQGGKWTMKSVEYIRPFVDFVPLWRFYPDMAAARLEDCRFVFERHRMTRADMNDLASRKSFRKDKIVSWLTAHRDGRTVEKEIDLELKGMGERETKQGAPSGMFDVLERWGWLSGSDLSEAGLEVPQERMHEAFFSNVWLLPDGTVIKAVLQPINGVTWPYHLYYFDKDETSIFGEGLATIMRDDQTMINAATRMILDNAAITSGPMFEVSPTLLASTSNITEMAPWKVFMRNERLPGTRAVVSVEVPTKLPELSAIAQQFENNADEVSAVPRYMSGENVRSGAAGTSSGLSMLMGAVNIVIKDLVGSGDVMTTSFLVSLYRWNMQFHNDPSIKGDFDPHARGTASLVAKEVRARQLNEFGALTANPMDAPYIKRDVLNRLRAEANELVDVVKTAEEVAAELNSPMAQAQQQLQLKIQQLELAEREAKVARMNAETARIETDALLARAKVVESKIESVFAALQAAGIAVSNPAIAPAGDEILRSSGWQDETPNPTIAQLGGPPVQPGQQVQAPQMSGTLNPQSAGTGQRRGIETAEIEGMQ